MGERKGRRSRQRVATGPKPGTYPVRFGEAELLADADRTGGWMLTVGGVAQSYVDLEDPTHLEFDYVRRMGDVLDMLPPAGAPLVAVHIGGGACTLPRYLAATRHGSRQLVIEADGDLVELVREQLDLRSVPKLRVRIGDGRAELATLGSDSADLLVVDAFERAIMPGGFATTEFAGEAARVLRATGTYLINLADGGSLRFGRRVIATLLTVFAEVAMLAEPAVLRGRRFGNLVVAASRRPLPVADLARRAAGAAFPARLVTDEDLRRFCGTAKPIGDAEAVRAPTPPPGAFGLGSW